MGQLVNSATFHPPSHTHQQTTLLQGHNGAHCESWQCVATLPVRRLAVATLSVCVLAAQAWGQKGKRWPAASISSVAFGKARVRRKEAMTQSSSTLSAITPCHMLTPAARHLSLPISSQRACPHCHAGAGAVPHTPLDWHGQWGSRLARPLLSPCVPIDH